MAKKRSIDEIILYSFEGSRQDATFPQFTDEEYIGYVTGIIMLQNPGKIETLTEVLKAVRRLFKDGRL